VLEGKLKDDGLFTIIYTLDDGDDWGDERNWIKANPNWGVSVYPRQLHQALTEAREFVHKEVEFKTKQWQRDGWIIETPGNVTDYDYIRKHIGELCERYNVQDISYDRYNSSQLVIQLTNDGLSMYPFGQGFVSMSAPTKELERKVKNKELTHDGNPVTRWMMGNIYLKTDPAGNVKIDKAKSGDKVDGAVSMVMALGGYMAGAAESKQDFWFVQL
jgi:phage terminase large subunit-like protein